MIEKPSYQLAFELDLDAPVEDAQQDWVSPAEAALREAEARTHFESGERPSWYEDYERLVYGGWPFRPAMYIAWASCPRKGREPGTLDGLASMMGLKSPRVIHVWRQRNPEIERQVAIMQAAPLFKHRADIIGALVESASDPDYRHAPDRRTALQLTGDLDETITLRRSGKKDDLSEMSDEELAAMAAALKTSPPGTLSVNAEGEEPDSEYDEEMASAMAEAQKKGEEFAAEFRRISGKDE